MCDLVGKTAVITGATKGIGKSIALAIIAKGANVICCGRNFSILKKELGNMVNSQDKIHFCPSDFLKKGDIIRLCECIINRSTNIDILIHSAGIIRFGPFENSTQEDFDAMWNVNLLAPYLITQRLLPFLQKSKGTIVFVNSTAGLDSWANISQYAATKHALTAMANSLKQELAPSGIKILSVYPGSTDTPMQRQIQEQQGNRYVPDKFMSPDILAEVVLRSICISEDGINSDIIVKKIPS